MKIKEHILQNKKIAEIISDKVLISNSQEGLDIIGNLYYQGYDHLIIHQKNLSLPFFDLKNGIAGEVFQKFTNYRIKLFIAGDFEGIGGKSLHAFILESNKGKQINFVPSVSEALHTITLQEKINPDL